MKLRRALCLILLTVPLRFSFATGMPVFDISNFMQAVVQVQTTIDQVMNTIEQVKNSYMQIQQQIDMVKKLDFKNLDFSSLNLGALIDAHDPAGSVRNIIDRSVQRLTEASNIISSKKVYIGPVEISMGKLIGIGVKEPSAYGMAKGIADHVLETGKEKAVEYAEKLTNEQVEAIKRRYNMDPENFASMKMVEEILDKGIEELFINGSGESIEAIITEAAECAVMLSGMSDEAGESVISQMQASAQGMGFMLKGLGDIRAEISRVGGFLAQQEMSKRVKEEIEAKVRETAALAEEKRSDTLSGIPIGY
jgi:hypothetical protein